MQIIIGTKNAGKISAVQQACDEYDILSDSTVHSCDVDSGVAPQPI